MNLLEDHRVQVIQRCFENGVSLRKTAIEAGCNRNTVLDYYKKLRTGWRVLPGFRKPVARLPVMMDMVAFEAISREAIDRSLSTRELAAEILNAVGKDKLFSAVLND